MRAPLLALLIVGQVASAQVTRDSAGASIHAYVAGARAPVQRAVNGPPVLSIGGSEGTGPSELAGVEGVLLLRGGGVAIANQGTSEIRVFGSDGRHLRTLGRAGSGPAEFTRITALSRSATGQLVGHDAAGEVEIFSVEGKHERTVPRPRLGERVFAGVLGLMTSGAVAASFVDSFPAAPPDRFSQAGVVALGDPAAGNLAIRVRALVMEFERGDGPAGYPGLPTGYVLPWFGAVGRYALFADRICHAFGDVWAVRCFHESGRLLWQTRRVVARAPVTQEDKEVLFAGSRRMNTRAPEEVQRRIISSFRFSERRPALGRLVPAATGELWVGEFQAAEWAPTGRQGRTVPAAATTWNVLDQRGRWRSDVRLPAGFLLLDADGDLVAGVERDADDVERVVVYRVGR